MRRHHLGLGEARADAAHLVLELEFEGLGGLLAERRFLLARKARRLLARQQQLAVGKLDAHQRRRPVAHRADDAARLPDARDQRLQRGIAVEVVHRPLAAHHEHAGIGALRRARERQRRVERRDAARIGEEGGVVGLGGIIAIGADLAALRAGDFDVDAIGAEDGPGLRQLVHLETRARLVAGDAVAADDEEDGGRDGVGGGAELRGKRGADDQQEEIQDAHGCLSLGNDAAWVARVASSGCQMGSGNVAVANTAH